VSSVAETAGSAGLDDGISISVSLVVYHSPEAELEKTLRSLGKAVRFLSESRFLTSCSLLVVDNTPGGQPGLEDLLQETLDPGFIDHRLIRSNTNLGFGRAHNRALSEGAGDFHLVLNPDVQMEEGALLRACEYLEAHPGVGLVTPRARDEQGQRQYLAKRYPSIADLLLRGFAPGWMRRRFSRRLAAYRLQGVAEDQPVTVDIASGCFMFFRSSVLHELGGFDPGFFMYFEDFDLSLRTASVASVAYVPRVRITHAGGGASKKGWRHIRMFARSALRFYGKHGWRWL